MARTITELCCKKGKTEMKCKDESMDKVRERIIDELIAACDKEGRGLVAGCGRPKGYWASWESNTLNGMPEKYQRMFNSGSGGELIAKACAVHSSSMLAYNFFSWIGKSRKATLQLSEWDQSIDFDEVFFEVRMKTLKDSPAPANMDVVLVGKDAFLMIESKFLEHLEQGKVKKEKVKSYLDKGKYYSNGEQWCGLMQKICDGTGDGYFSGLKQNFCHLVALSNLISGEKQCLKYFQHTNKELTKTPVRMLFANIVYRPASEFFPFRKNPYDRYRELWEKYFNGLEDGLTAPLPKLSFISYDDIWRQLRDQMPRDVREYLLRRYMQFTDAST